jgi:hypothetical protein
MSGERALRPVVPAGCHLVVAGPGAAGAVAAMLASATAEVLGATEVLLTVADVPALERYGVLLHVAADEDDLLASWSRLLAGATMGTRLYAAGTAALLASVGALAAAQGVDPASVVTERTGAPGRRVRCVHCRHTSDGVVAGTVVCEGCGLTLEVRDLYSRRLAAHQGVWVGP